MTDNQYRDFFADEKGLKQSKHEVNAGRIGWMALHAIKAIFLLYSGYHGGSVAIAYAGNLPGAAFFQVLGIISIELTIGALYMAAVTKRVNETYQWLAAGITWGVGMTLASLGIVGDSMLNAGVPLSSFLVSYLHYGLPIAPAIMAIGGVAVLLTDPDHTALSAALAEQRKKERDITKDRHTAAIAKLSAELAVEKAITNFQLNAKMQRAELIEKSITERAVQQAQREKAAQDSTYYLESQGVYVARPPQLSVTAIPLDDHPPTAGNGVARPTPPPSH